MVIDGSRIMFWHDIWCGDQILMEPYPELFLLEASLADHLQISNSFNQQDVDFIKEE